MSSRGRRSAVRPCHELWPRARPVQQSRGSRSVLPCCRALHEAVAIGERLRVAAMSQSRRISGDAHPSVLGPRPGPLRPPARDVPRDQRRQQNADSSITSSSRRVVASTNEDIIALQRLRRLWGRGGHDLELVARGSGIQPISGVLIAPRSPVLGASRILGEPHAHSSRLGTRKWFAASKSTASRTSSGERANSCSG